MLTGIFDSSIIGMHRSIEKYDRLVKRGEDTELIRDMVEIMKVGNEFKANTRAIKVADDMIGSIIDIMA